MLVWSLLQATKIREFIPVQYTYVREVERVAFLSNTSKHPDEDMLNSDYNHKLRTKCHCCNSHKTYNRVFSLVQLHALMHSCSVKMIMVCMHA